MRMKLFLLVFIVIVIGLLFQPGCKTTEAWEFNMTGTWNFNISCSSCSPTNWTNTLTFAGGTVTGNIKTYVGEIGTYTVSGASVSINWAFVCGCSANTTWNFTATASESNPDYLSGTGSWYHAPGPAYDLTFTAIRL